MVEIGKSPTNGVQHDEAIERHTNEQDQSGSNNNGTSDATGNATDAFEISAPTTKRTKEKGLSTKLAPLTTYDIPLKSS